VWFGSSVPEVVGDSEVRLVGRMMVPALGRVEMSVSAEIGVSAPRAVWAGMAALEVVPVLVEVPRRVRLAVLVIGTASSPVPRCWDGMTFNVKRITEEYRYPYVAIAGLWASCSATGWLADAPWALELAMILAFEKNGCIAESYGGRTYPFLVEAPCSLCRRSTL
jgi:hypothetical protein